MNDVKVVEKVLRSLTENFNYVVCSIEESKDTDAISVDELQSSLLEGVAVVGEFPLVGVGVGVVAERLDFDKSTVECYRYQMGHFAYECPCGEKPVNYAEFDKGEDLILMAHVEFQKESKTGIWFLDLACSYHMTGCREWFINFDESFKHSVKLGNDLRLMVKGIGEVRFEVEGISQVISQVYYVPELTSNLLSIRQLQEKDLAVVIRRGVCKIYHPQRGLIITSRITRNRMSARNADEERDCGVSTLHNTLNNVMQTDRGVTLTKEEHLQVADLTCELSKYCIDSPVASPLIFGGTPKARHMMRSCKHFKAVKAEAMPHVVEAPDVVRNKVSFSALGFLDGQVSLKGKLMVLDEKWIKVVFEPPRLKLGSVEFQFGGESEVQLEITYIDDKLRMLAKKCVNIIRGTLEIKSSVKAGQASTENNTYRVTRGEIVSSLVGFFLL
ncbi:hypothetical protein E3N88_18991 [Mikania micrantha]|uniref:Retrovirus-related Pol polyprotein from transposon TNT 1-94-like beta-barrel domain-containing protein n=1 Tax=Mikania micrantha TaxID=192012 RepID=A0A5N6NPB8_9ASTR|nr:hypothetical protein E3N88_18991 [Mikania micrantha]